MVKEKTICSEDMLIDVIGNGQDPLAGRSVAEIQDSKINRETRRYLQDAVTSIAAIKGISDLQVQKKFTDILFLDAELEVTRSMIAARMWNAIVGGPITQLVAYYEGGVKPEVLANIIVNLGQLGALTKIAGEVD